jgi:hypothetical protein
MKIISRQEAKALGLKRYFTGEPCKNGHVCERYVLCAKCTGCLLVSTRIRMRKSYNAKNGVEKSRAWRKKNPEKARAQKQRYRQRYRERERIAVNIRCRKWRAKNPEKNREYKRRAEIRILEMHPTGENAWLKGTVQTRVIRRLLRSPRAAWKSLIAEYGLDPNTLK